MEKSWKLKSAVAEALAGDGGKQKKTPGAGFQTPGLFYNFSHSMALLWRSTAFQCSTFAHGIFFERLINSHL